MSNAGGRLIIAIDRVWDALSFEKAANCGWGLRAELAAKQIVKVQITFIRKANQWNKIPVHHSAPRCNI